MKTLKFGTVHMERVIRGEKLITVRRYRSGAHDFSNGEIVMAEFLGALKFPIEITANTEKKTFAKITDAEAKEDGFPGTQDLIADMAIYYPELSPADACAIIRFKVAELDGEQVVQFAS